MRVRAAERAARRQFGAGSPVHGADRQHSRPGRAISAQLPAGRDQPLRGAGQPQYRLDIRLAEQRADIGLRRDDIRTRTNLTLEAEYRLVALVDGKVVLQGRSRTLSSFDILINDYANVVSEQEARQQALRQIGADIRTRLSLHFRQDQPAS